MKKILKFTILSVFCLLLFLIIGLSIYSSTAYKPLDEMYDEISLFDASSIIFDETLDHISLTVQNPRANIIFIPGGLVMPESYLYLGYRLAQNGFNITISKPLFHLAILTPNYTKKFIDDKLDNIFIGHSLGGLIASNVSASNNNISKLVLLASYPNQPNDTEALSITATNDNVINTELLIANTPQYLSNYESFSIVGGNHSGFGWYGQQKGDGPNTLSIKDQQDIVVLKILDFIN